MKLTGFTKEPEDFDNPNNNAIASDRRWMNRKEIWDIAKNLCESLLSCDSEQMRVIIVKIAKKIGCWSIWMTVFSNDKDMLKRFIENFEGTATNCFNENYEPIGRIIA